MLTLVTRKFKLFSTLAQQCVCLAFCLVLSGCDRPVNSPRPLEQYADNTLFTSFSGRSPKTLDPQVSYSSDETIYTYGIYEPLYQYHYLQRPYRIEPRTAVQVVSPIYRDAQGAVLPAAAPARQIAYSVYRIAIKKGIEFAPHPAFARNARGEYLYHHLAPEQIDRLAGPLDLPEKGTRELVAEDYVYGIKRLASPQLVSPVLSLLSEHIVGLGDLARQLQTDAPPAGSPARLDLRRYSLAGVRALDRYTLEITVHGKYPQFSNWLAMAFFAPMPWEAEVFYAQPGFAQNNISLATWPVGTGPYRLARSLPNREHVLERNPLYRFDPYPCQGESGDRAAGYLEDCGKPIPFIDRIVLTLEKESVPTTTKFLQGYYDSPQISRLDVGQGYLVAAQDSEQKAALYAQKQLKFPTTVESSLWYMGFNWLDPVVGQGATPQEARRNRLLRQAISIAVDWEEQIAIFEKGQGMAAHGPLPPGLFGWNTDGRSAFNPLVYEKDAAGRPVRRSVEQARALMREAGYPDGRDAVSGKPLVLYFDWQGASPGSKSFLNWFTKQFAKIGIQLEIRASDYNRFQDKMARGAAQIYYWGWVADYPDAENFLFLLYGPNRKVGGGSGGENASNYSNREYDRLFEQMRFMEDGPDKARIIETMLGIVQRDAPWSFGYFPTSAAALHQWVGNAKPTQVVRNNVQYMRIDAAVRRERIAQWNRPVLWPLALIVLVVGGGLAAVRVHVRREQQRTALPAKENS